ncbi:2375_t:CDS:2 [Funneliformis mosseae]|uniref:2375_t:CDS:1 n=1 Tax=Funneliformis mosseae TaxID=27381 RepID=A0A9N8VAD0_FUNMO|nr:2375_t:CDS:2 [Funneliformis mosseae]
MTYIETAYIKLSINNKLPSNNIQNRSALFPDTSETISTLNKKVKEFENKFKVLSDLFNNIKEEELMLTFDLQLQSVTSAITQIIPMTNLHK